MRLNVVAMVACLALAPALMGQGTKTILDARHLCQASVPGNWTINTVQTGGNSPDGKSDAAIAAPTGQSLAVMKQYQMKLYSAGYLKVNLTEDTAHGFQIEASDQGNGPVDGSVYRAWTFGANVCLVQANYQNGDVATARAIAKSLSAK